jgi:hypothetical protein
MDKLRPITLLETMRKLFRAITGRRLQHILESNNVLKGHNFGFRKGKSTNDNITIIKSIIDIAKIQHRCLLIGNLDIRKAFDTITPQAKRTSMQRIRIPERYIKMIETMDQLRTLNIDTPFGETEYFHPPLV